MGTAASCLLADHSNNRKGLKDIADLKQAYKDQISTLRKQAIAAGAEKPIAPASTPEDIPPSVFPPGPPPAPAQPSSSRSSAKAQTDVPPGLRTLSSYLDIEKIQELPQSEIEALWRLRHAHKPQSLYFTIPAKVYAHIALNAQKHPQFILPLPREGQGAEIHFLQWTFPHPDVVNILFTHLAEYKLRGEYASPHTTVSLHLEMVKDKGMVLGQGMVLEKRGITVDEAKWLMICLQKFYGAKGTLGGKDKPKELLEQFSSGDERFNVAELLEEAEKLG